MKLLFENWRKYLKEKEEELDEQKDDNPCWDGYEMIGTKKKDGKEVPNCVPIQTEESDKERMKCNSPRYIKKGEPGYGKKQKVVKACKGGKEKIVRFGDANMENRSDNPKRKKAFRDRHNCADKKDKFAAGYWSCKDW
jgi:hypothetical protein